MWGAGRGGATRLPGSGRSGRHYSVTPTETASGSGRPGASAGFLRASGRRARLEGDRGQGDRACASPTGSRNRRAATANAESEVGPRCGALSSRSPPRGTGTSPGQTSQQSATSLSGLGLGLDSRLPGGLPKPCVKPLPRAVRTARPGRRGRTPRWLSKARASPEQKTLGRAERPSLAGLGARGVHGWGFGELAVCTGGDLGSSWCARVGVWGVPGVHGWGVYR